MAEKQVRFADLLILHLNNQVKKRIKTNNTLDHGTLREIRDCVHNTCRDVFSKSTHRLTEDAVGWVANQFFKSIKLSTTDGEMSINELVVINDYKLADLPYHDIQLMKNLFNETRIGQELNEEYSRRSAS